MRLADYSDADGCLRLFLSSSRSALFSFSSTVRELSNSAMRCYELSESLRFSSLSFSSDCLAYCC